MFENAIRDNLTDFYSVINGQLSTSGDNIAQTPASYFGADRWHTLLQACTVAIVPLAFTILAFCLAIDLLQVYEKNGSNLDAELITITSIKYILPFLIISNTYSLLEAFTTIINSYLKQLIAALHYTPAQTNSIVDSIMASVNQADFGRQFGLWVQTGTISLISHIIGIFIFVIVIGRLFEMALLWVISPVPMAFLVNTQERQLAFNFFKQFFALLLQGFLMIICLYLYSIVATRAVANYASAGNASLADFGTQMGSFWGLIGLSVVLVAALKSTDKLSKRILNTF
ncbi:MULTISPECIES: VirB6/TrbL-like conjugal transfer protein, CD1112 family [Caproicibacterium]|uniref:CD0415/CD1112 family protein n=1 Tax=Caproicibacterium argilliputei TaxID=3030016 RepID=A0AA97DBT8_9FIRM|nr:CD0415/CD1112 family protein [Caproicibacterium argilliputei]WOC32887.1 CD0415/CD1112 family protein [Caproicibacterium argilliputei]